MNYTIRQKIYIEDVKYQFKCIINPKLWDTAMPKIMNWIFHTTKHSDCTTPDQVRIAYNRIAAHGYKSEDFDIMDKIYFGKVEYKKLAENEKDFEKPVYYYQEQKIIDSIESREKEEGEL